MQDRIDPPGAPFPPLTLRELAVLLIKHHGLHEGLYDPAFEFQIAIGGVGPQQDALLPGAMIGVSRIGLAIAEKTSGNTVDAAVVNPRKTTTSKAKGRGIKKE